MAVSVGVPAWPALSNTSIHKSRLGATPWSSPLRYLENSPLFTMDKVQTPILIMHNDADGHVPWYQGIEYFVAMKRLGKPCWLLNYTGEPHWPMHMGKPHRFPTPHVPILQPLPEEPEDA